MVRSIPPIQTEELGTLVGMSRQDGQRLLMWTDGKIEKVEYVNNVIHVYEKRSYIDYLILSNTVDQKQLHEAARRFHLPILDFNFEPETKDQDATLRLLHHWGHMHNHGMATSAILFNTFSDGTEIWREFCRTRNIPYEIVKVWS